MKLQTKMISTLVLISLLTNIIFLFSYTNNQSQAENDRLELKIDNLCELLNQVNSGPLYDYDIDKVETNLQSFLKDREIYSIALSEPQGGTNLFFSKEYPRPDFSSLIEKSIDINFKDETIGHMKIVFTKNFINLRMRENIIQLLFSNITVLIIIAFVLIVLLRRFMSPISELTEFSRDILNDRLTKEIDIKRNDELGILAKSFTKMKSTINQKIDFLEIENERRIEAVNRSVRQQEAIFKIASESYRYNNVQELFQLITEASGEAISVARVSIWMTGDDQNNLDCEDLYLYESDEHRREDSINRKDCPLYFKSVDQEKIISIPDVSNEFGTSKLLEEYFKNNSIKSLLDSPIWIHGKVVGVICFESVSVLKDWKKDEEVFAQRVSEQITSFLIDIEHKKVSEELSESEERYRTLVENASEAIVVFDMDKNYFLEANTNAEILFGVEREKLLNFNPSSVSPVFQFDGRSSEDASNKYLELAFEGKPQVFDWSYLNLSTGKEVLCEVRLIKLPSSASRLVRGSIIDVSERKMQERELRHLRNYLINIIDSMPSVIVGVDDKCIVTQWNKRSEDVSGISSENAIGKSLVELLPEYRDESTSILNSIKTGEIIYNKKQLKVTEAGKLYEDITIYPLTGQGEDGAVIRIDDVSELVRLEEIMVQSEKMLSVGGLAAGMAHEINNPLAGMMQTANVLSNRLGGRKHIQANIDAAEKTGTTLEAIEAYMDKRDIPRMLKTISEAGHRIASIVDNMLSFSRKSDGSTSTHDMNKLLDRTLDLAATDYNLKKQHDFKMINIKKEYDYNIPSIPCESAKIQQVILNILRNGAEAMQESGIEKPEFIIKTSIVKNTSMLKMEIEDNGPGMNNEVRRRIFEPFFTTKAVGVGTGLGLSVSYFIITENHNGKMSVESRKDSGSRFIIELPLEIAFE